MRDKLKKLLIVTLLIVVFVGVAVINPPLGLTLLPLFGAVSINVIRTTNDEVVRDVVATADADTTATIPHGLGAIPGTVILTELLQVPAAISAWAATTIDTTNVVLTKGVGVGSGDAAAQLRVFIKRAR